MSRQRILTGFILMNMADGLTQLGNGPQSRRMLELLIRTLKTEQAINKYLHYPNPNLDGEMPITLLKRGEFDRVAADLLALSEGVYL